MVVTVTFSPALDYVVDLRSFKVGNINRTVKEEMLPGGKGINVSLVLAHLGTESLATGFLGGFTGEFIKEKLDEEGVKHDFVSIKGNSRINVKIRCGKETAINAQGPLIPEEKIEELIKKLEKLTPEDLLIISGTVPSSLPADIYERILERIAKCGNKVIIDSNGEILLKTLKYHPLLVKPNQDELGEMFRTDIQDEDDLKRYSLELIRMGAENVIVSLGGDGAFLVGKDHPEPLHLKAPQGRVVNTVGAGDSLVAGFADEYLRSHDLEKAFRQGIAAGSASAFSEGLAQKTEVEKLLQSME